MIDEIELLDGASAEFDHGTGDKRRTFPGIFRFCADQLWCGDIFAAFPENDYITASKKSLTSEMIDPISGGFFCICI